MSPAGPITFTENNLSGRQMQNLKVMFKREERLTTVLPKRFKGG